MISTISKLCSTNVVVFERFDTCLFFPRVWDSSGRLHMSGQFCRHAAVWVGDLCVDALSKSGSTGENWSGYRRFKIHPRYPWVAHWNANCAVLPCFIKRSLEMKGSQQFTHEEQYVQHCRGIAIGCCVLSFMRMSLLFECETLHTLILDTPEWAVCLIGTIISE